MLLVGRSVHSSSGQIQRYFLYAIEKDVHPQQPQNSLKRDFLPFELMLKRMILAIQDLVGWGTGSLSPKWPVQFHVIGGSVSSFTIRPNSKVLYCISWKNRFFSLRLDTISLTLGTAGFWGFNFKQEDPPVISDTLWGRYACLSGVDRGKGPEGRVFKFTITDLEEPLTMQESDAWNGKEQYLLYRYKWLIKFAVLAYGTPIIVSALFTFTF